MRRSFFSEEFVFLPKSDKKASFGQPSGKYPFYTSSDVLKKRSDTADYYGPALIFGTGGNASLHYAEGAFSTSSDCLVAKPKRKNSSTMYTGYFIKSNIHLLQRGFRGAGLKHISKEYISELSIPIFEYDDQLRIAAVLSRTEALIAKRKESLALLDEFVKSTFLILCGPENPEYQEWEPRTIESLAAKHKGAMRTGPFGSNLLHSEFSDTGDVAVIGIDNAVQNHFVWGEPRFITLEKYEKLTTYRVYPGDVVITLMGTIGRSAVIPDDIHLAINTKHLAAITLDQSEALPVFLSYAIHSHPSILSQLRQKTRGAIMGGLNLGLIKEIEFPKPPLPLQQRFAEIVLKVESVKDYYRSSLHQLEALYSSLGSRAFKGELDLSRVPAKPEEASDDRIPAAGPEDTPILDAVAKGNPAESFWKAVLIGAGIVAGAYALAKLFGTEEEGKKKRKPRLSRESFRKALRGKPRGTFTFEELWDEMLAEFEDAGSYYDDLTKWIYALLEEEDPILVLEFDEERKEMVFRVAP